MALNFNVDPYYDDFDVTKNFHRILFKPGFAVQARELTQSQTIMQDQISKFGNGIYNDGSKVSGANITVDTNIVTVKLTSAVETQIESYVGLFVVGQTSKFIAEVKEIDAENFYLKTKPVNIANGKKFSSAETLNFYNTKVDALASLNSTVSPVYTAAVATSATYTRLSSGTYLTNELSISTSNITVGDTIKIDSVNYTGTVTSITANNTLVLSSVLPQDITNASTTVVNEISVKSLEVGIDEGVWFSNGFFIRNSADTIIPDALNAYPSVVVGFEVNENIIDSFNDSSLLDPAVGASNYQAPGADRYRITLDLVTKPYISNQVVANLTTNKFIELVRINQGVVEDINDVPVFSSISKQIARTVYDTSGDFVVNPFSLLIGNSATTANTIQSSISAGKVYLQGSPVEHIARTPFILEKARDIESLDNENISTYYGNYTIIKNIRGKIVNFQQGEQVELHNVAFGAASSATRIGTARVRNFDYHSNTDINIENKMFIYEANITSTTGQSFANVASVIIPNAGNYSTPTFAANTVSPVSLTDSNFNSLIFPLPQKNISNISSVSYETNRYYSAASFSSGVVTINTNGPSETFVGGSGSIAAAQRRLNYMVVTTSSSGAYAAGTLIPMDRANVTITITNSPGTPQATINIGGNFSGTATIMARINEDDDTIKSKVLNANTAILTSANTINTVIDLGVSDVYKFRGIYEIGNNTSWQGTWSSGTTYAANTVTAYAGNVYLSLTGSNANNAPNTSPSYWSQYTSNAFNYITDDGQRDTHYDHGTIRNKSGSAKGNVVVMLDYFTHSGGQGFFTVDSYTIDYADIPSFTSQQYGTTYNLRDVLDFRPRRTDGVGVTTFDTFQLTAPFENSIVDYGYYLGRSDKIVLYPNGQFKTVRGVSSYINPISPADVPGAFTAFTITYPPYTFDKKDVVVVPNNTRRYTMKDIGVLDKRIFNLEYYTSLSVLENQVTGSDVTDSTGSSILFKNGFLVDSFKGQGVGDVLNSDYKIAIDFSNQIARPTFASNVASFTIDTNQGVFNTGKLNNYLSIKNNVITFSYNERNLVFQNVATQIINVNPFNVINFVGDLKLTPSSDVWYDNQTQPIINIVNEDQAAWIAAVNGTGNGSQWNDWEINWSGQNPIQTNDQSEITRNTQAITNAIAAKGLSGAVSGGNIQVSATTKIISNAIVPYARRIPITFQLDGMAPYTNLHTFMNGVCVDLYTTPKPGYYTGLSKIDISSPGSGYTNGNNQSIITITGANTRPAIATANVSGGQIVAINILSGGEGYRQAPTITVTGANTGIAVLVANTTSYAGAPLTTDESGRAEGTIEVPNDSFLRMPTGPIIVEFSDNIFTPMIGSAYARSTFYAQGTLQTSQTTVVSTRPPQVSPKSVQVVDRGDVTPVENRYYTNDAMASGSSEYEIGSQKQNDYINAFANSIAQSYLGDTNFALNPDDVNNVYNDAILPILQANLPPGYTTPTGTMALAAVTFVLNEALRQGPPWDQATIDAVAKLEQVCIDNSPNLQELATAYVTDPSVAGAYVTAALAADGAVCNGRDPLSQNFYVNATLYPNGVFVSSVDLFFATKDPTIPVSVRIRPTVNGYPDAVNDIPGSIVNLKPSQINIPLESEIQNGIGPATKFTFDHPIYLRPGEYTVMVLSNSNKYNVYASKLGQVELGTTNTVTQLNYLGSLFKSQNASTWVPAPGETMAFVLNICEFAGGSATFDVKSKASTQINYDLMHLITSDLSFTNIDSINYKVLTYDLATSTQSPETTVIANENINFSARQKQSSANDIIVRATVTNTDKWTSPVVDLERLNTVLVTNNITPYESANTTAESLGGIGNGTAVARYITRRVTLNNNFDSTGLTVFVDVNRQPGTKIEVYYKVMNAIDSNNFDDLPYVLMSPILTPGSGLSNTGPTDYVSDTYQALGITYNDISTGVTYSNFKVFAIKVVMYSDNPAFVPQIKNFRAIATA